ncbi:MAG TPA: DUF3530 family protein [Marinobacter sp.]|nr:DUF3530 family protein [Marinobacter sp.]
MVFGVFIANNNESETVCRDRITVCKWLHKLRVFILCLGCFVTISAVAENTASKAETGEAVNAPSRSGVLTGLGESALSKAYPDETVWLNIGSDDKVLGLLFTERALPVKGALIILPDQGETAVSGVAGSLAQRLADKGWAVLTVGHEAPSSSLRVLLERKPDAPKETSGTGADNTTLEVDISVDDPAEGPTAVYRERIEKTLQAGLTVLADRGYKNPALLAVGRASSYITGISAGSNSIRAVIWVAPVFYPQDKATLGKRLSTAGVHGVLELYNSQTESLVSGNQRAVMLRQEGITGYERQPVAVHQPPAIQDAPALANRIDAWLQLR